MRAKTWRLIASVGVCLQLGLMASTHAASPGVASPDVASPDVERGASSVEHLLSSLSHAVQEKNYRGLFTYEYGGTLDTLKIVHVVRDGREYGRLQHLSGPERKIIRNDGRISCVSTGAQLLRGGLFAPHPNGAQLHEYYNLTLGGSERVADRLATVVRLIPKDRYRYGFVLSIDKASGFPLKTLVVGKNHRVLERIQFIDLDMGITADSVQPEKSEGSSQAVPVARVSCAEESPVQAAVTGSDALKWQAQWLPEGFVLSEYSYNATDGHQLTYTDGLASFSVFITPAKMVKGLQPGLARRGATVALMLTSPVKNHPASVAIVGEIPPITAQKVAVNVRPVTIDKEQGDGAR